MPDVLVVIGTLVGFAALLGLCKGGRAAVSAQNIVALVVALALAAYLVSALLFPERF